VFQCKYGRSASSVHQGGTKSSDPISLVGRCVPGAEIHRRLSTQYGVSALPHRSVYERIEKFTSGRTNVTHEEGAGSLSTSTTDEKIQQAREMVRANRRVAIDEVACSLQISHGSAYDVFVQAYICVNKLEKQECR